MRAHSHFNGAAHISPSGQKYRVWIQGLNVTAEVYISRKQAVELRDRLDSLLATRPSAAAAGEEGEAR